MDSTKLLTEKLALSRDLAAIAPEVEHLRSQAASHQGLLSEKLSLQRQLSTVQVELETEKRTTQRALAKEGGRRAQDAQLESQLEDLQAELGKERRLRQKAERDLQQTISESDSKQTSLELKAARELKHALQEAESAQTVLSSRLDAFRTKLRSTKEQLKEAQDELKDARLKVTADVAPSKARQDNSNDLNPRKRSIARLDVSNIGTPDGMPYAKRTRQGSTIPGDKSTFSITPFLNKTASVAPDSPKLADAIHQPTVMTASAENKGEAGVSSGGPDDGGQTEIALSRKGAGKLAPRPAKANRKEVAGARSKKLANLEQVQEEGEDEPFPARSIVNRVVTAELVENPQGLHNMDDTAFLKRKRKLLSGGGLGKTLFDECEGDEDGLIQRAPSALCKPIQLAARRGLQPKKSETSIGGFGAISPLKRDKRTGRPTVS